MIRLQTLIQLASVLLAVLALSYGVAGLVLSSPAQLYVSFACIAGLIPLAATLLDHKRTDALSPIGFIALSVLFGTTATSFWLTGAETARTNYLMFGQTFEDLANGQYWVIIALASLCAGYILVVPGSRTQVVPRALNARRVRFALLVLLVASVVGVLLFVASFGIDFSDFTAQSIKRTNQYVSDSGEVVYGAGFEATLAKLSGVGFVFASCLVIAEGPRRTYILYALVFFALTVFVGFISSSRASIVYVIASVIIFAYYYRRLEWKSVLVAAVLTVSVVIGLGLLRAENTSNTDQFETIADVVLGTGNGFDSVRTSAFMARVPERHDFLYGSSYLSLLTVPVPRSVWPDKPNVSLGPWVKSELYGLPTRNNGWPPGMVAEAYFNFGYAGIPLVMFLFGAGLRLLYGLARPYLGISAVITMAYSISMLRFAYSSFSLNFSQGVLQAIQYTWPFLLIGLYVTSSTRKKTSALAMR